MVKLLLKLLLVLVILISFTFFSSAHKDAAQSLQTTSDMIISLGLNPSFVVVEKPQSMFLNVLDNKNNKPIKGLNAKFQVYFSDVVNSKEVLLNEYYSKEKTPGVYTAVHVFSKKGTYLIKAQLFNKEKLITESSKSVYAEPEKPSLNFFVFMIISVLLGLYVGSRSHCD